MGRDESVLCVLRQLLIPGVIPPPFRLREVITVSICYANDHAQNIN